MLEAFYRTPEEIIKAWQRATPGEQAQIRAFISTQKNWYRNAKFFLCDIRRLNDSSGQEIEIGKIITAGLTCHPAENGLTAIAINKLLSNVPPKPPIKSPVPASMKIGGKTVRVRQ